MRRPYSVSSIPREAEPHLQLERRRHETKVKDAIRHHLADMVQDEKIVMSDGRRSVSVPIPQFTEFRMRYDHQSTEHVGHAPGSGEGADEDAGQTGHDAVKAGGNAPGMDLEETEITLEDVREAVFRDMELPNLDIHKPAPGTGRDPRPVTTARSGIMAHWDKKRTLYQALRRRQATASSTPPLLPEDLRFRVYESAVADHGGAVVLAMMDTSGSMGSFEKYLAKSFFFWTTEFLRQKYPTVNLVFLAHDVRAREVDEETFFHRGASGGTVSSSVYRLALDVIEERFPPDRFNIYAFHFTDGGNLTSDNQLAVDMGARLAHATALFGYGEIHDTERNPSPLYQEFAQGPEVGVTILRSKEDIFEAMMKFFGKGPKPYVASV